MSQNINHKQIVSLLLLSKAAIRVTAAQMDALESDDAVSDRLCSCHPRKGDGLIVFLSWPRADDKRWLPPNFQRLDDRTIADAGPCVLA